jgi:hypothetical protein
MSFSLELFINLMEGSGRIKIGFVQPVSEAQQALRAK